MVIYGKLIKVREGVLELRLDNGRTIILSEHECGNPDFRLGMAAARDRWEKVEIDLFRNTPAFMVGMWAQLSKEFTTLLIQYDESVIRTALRPVIEKSDSD